MERIRLDKAAVDEGFGIPRADDGDWLAYESLGAPAAIRLTVVPGGYVAAIDHAGVAGDLALRWPLWDGASPPGFTAFVVRDTAPLQELVREMWRLARASAAGSAARVREADPRAAPDHRGRAAGRAAGRAGRVPRRTHGLPGRPLRRHRLRRALAPAREPHQALGAVRDHAERLDVKNGLLLAAHLDAAFDCGLIDFDAAGQIRFAARFLPADRLATGLDDSMKLAKLTPEHRVFLSWRRAHLLTAAATRSVDGRPEDGTRVRAPGAVRQRISPSQEEIRTQCRTVGRHLLDIERQFKRVPNGPM